MLVQVLLVVPVVVELRAFIDVAFEEVRQAPDYILWKSFKFRREIVARSQRRT